MTDAWCFMCHRKLTPDQPGGMCDACYGFYGQPKAKPAPVTGPVPPESLEQLLQGSPDPETDIAGAHDGGAAQGVGIEPNLDGPAPGHAGGPADSLGDG